MGELRSDLDPATGIIHTLTACLLFYSAVAIICIIWHLSNGV